MLVPGAAGALWDEADGRSAEACGVLHRSVRDPASQRRLFFFFLALDMSSWYFAMKWLCAGAPDLYGIA